MAGNVYFIRCNDFVKVGYAKDVHARLRDLQIGSPYELELIVAIPESQKSLEKIFHRILRRKAVRGEWFKLDEDVRSFIYSLAELLGADPGSLPRSDAALQMVYDSRRTKKQVRAEYFSRLEERRAEQALLNRRVRFN